MQHRDLEDVRRRARVSATPTAFGAAAEADQLRAVVFTDLERRVLDLAAHDPLSSTRGPGRLGRATSWIFAQRRVSGLADPRLEALRRFAVVARRAGRRSVARERERFLAAGYSPTQADLVTWTALA